MNTYFLAIQNTYTTVQIALFDANSLRLCVEEDKRYASKCIIPLCSTILNTLSLSLNDLSFIAVNQGPGPFTTLRTVIASVNGISFATGLPLIGVDALQAFAREQRNPVYPYTVLLLNAYTNEVYYAIDRNSTTVATGCKSIKALLTELHHSLVPAQTIRFIGGGVDLHKAYISEVFKDQAIIPNPNPEACSIQQIASTALKQWNKQENLSYHVLPLYLKRIAVKKTFS